MRIILSTLKKVLFWSYERGSWQYDVMCVLILLFIFAFPNRFLHTAQTMDARVDFEEPIFVSREEVGQVDSARVNYVIAEHLARKYGRAVTMSELSRTWTAQETSQAIWPGGEKTEMTSKGFKDEAN